MIRHPPGGVLCHTQTRSFVPAKLSRSYERHLDSAVAPDLSYLFIVGRKHYSSQAHAGERSLACVSKQGSTENRRKVLMRYALGPAPRRNQTQNLVHQ